jgi:hypothetical protein
MASVFNTFFPAGFRLISGTHLNRLFNNPITSVEDNIVAKAGGGQTNAYQLSAAVSRVVTVASASDSVKLPKAVAGNQYEVINDGANALQIFGTSPDTIDGVATGTGVTITNARRSIFWCVTNGAWQSAGMAKST